MAKITEHDALMRIAQAARAFMWQPEMSEIYEDLKTSNSADVPPEFMELGGAIEDYFGPAKKDGE